jgi:hypothetical protein
VTGKKTKSIRKLRVIMLADEKLLPTGNLSDFSEKQRELRKTEFDVRDAIEELGPRSVGDRSFRRPLDDPRRH